MKANPNVDELLNSFVDGELPPRQRTEVQRLAARDPEVGRRLRQLQDCKILVSAMPRAEAPPEMLERIKLSLERKTLLADQSLTGASTAGAIRLMMRRFIAAAAMIALLAVLGAVVYQIVAPVPGSSSPGHIAAITNPQPTEMPRPVPVPTVVADAGFTGRLEIRTATLAQADAALGKAIRENGLSGLVVRDGTPEMMTYKIVCTRQGVNRLIAGLQGVWRDFSAATLDIEGSGEHATRVTIDAVTPEQMAGIIAGGNTRATMDMARQYATLNSMPLNMPGREVLAMIRDDAAGARELVTFDGDVRLAGDRDRKDTTVTPPQGEYNVTLTIVLLHIR